MMEVIDLLSGSGLIERRDAGEPSMLCKGELRRAKSSPGLPPVPNAVAAAPRTPEGVFFRKPFEALLL